MKNLSGSQNIIITTIIFYLVVIVYPGDAFTLPIVINVITELTNLMHGYSKPAFMNGFLPLAAVMILMIATSERVRRKDWLYILSIIMLVPSVLADFKMNRQVNGWSIMTFSIVPFCIVTFVGLTYFMLKWVKKYMRDN